MHQGDKQIKDEQPKPLQELPIRNDLCPISYPEPSNLRRKIHLKTAQSRMQNYNLFPSPGIATSVYVYFFPSHETSGQFISIYFSLFSQYTNVIPYKPLYGTPLLGVASNHPEVIATTWFLQTNEKTACHLAVSAVNTPNPNMADHADGMGRVSPKRG